MMRIIMKSVAFLLCCIAGAALLAVQPAQLSRVRSVYLFPMANGMDQFLASRLTTAGVLQVVTDPKKADAVFTDHLGLSFERRFEDLYPAPKPEPAPEPEGPSDAGTQPKGEERVQISSFGRGKGTVFLVDRKTRAVIWSTYEKPKNSSPEQLDRTAQRITTRLKGDLQGK
jgi:hypothetical protein